jgi:glycosyltransferase involved in cell wall biosynthesis
MSTPPLISVALSTYNGERFLPEQLESVLAQDYPRIEVVAVDDASTDGSFALLERYAARDARIRVCRNPTNVGYRRNFEIAVGLCHGDLIAPCDQDDVWLPTKLGILQRAMGEAPAAYCDSELVDEQGRSLGRRMSDRFVMRRVVDPAIFLFGSCISGHALLFRQSLLQRALPVPAGVYHDWWLGFVAGCSGPVEYVAEPLVRYRQHTRTVTDVLHGKHVVSAFRSRGYRLAGVEATECRLRAAAAYPGVPDAAFFASVLQLWLGWERHWVCPRLTAFMLRHRHRLFALRRTDRHFDHTRHALKHLRGLRLKRFLEPRAYRRP